MHRQRALTGLIASAALALILALPAAAQLPEGFKARNIGDGQGSTTYDAATGKFTVRGQGADLWGNDNDHFHFVSKEVDGDGTISLRFVSSTPGHDDGWQKNGAMIRENDTQGSPHVTVEMTNRGASGLYLHRREEQDGESQDQTGYTARRFPIYLRVQRVGNEFSGYYSDDGKLWTYMNTYTAVMGSKANYGMCVMSHDADNPDTCEFDNVQIGPGANTVYGLQGCGSDNGVLLTWKALKGATAYNVYRGTAADNLVKIGDGVKETSYSDLSADLVAGQRLIYAVAAIQDGKEGSLVSVRAGKSGPPTPPAGFNFSLVGSNNEGDCAVGSVGVSVDASGVITMRGGGHDIWDDGDDCVLLHQKVAGKARITVTMLTSPTGTSSWSKAGPMFRENTSRGSRHGFFALTGFDGLVGQWRGEANSGSETLDRALQWNEVHEAITKAPITLRATRDGDNITLEYSLDGSTFTSGGDPITLSGLANELEAGVALTSHNQGRISEVKFRDLKVEKL
jgi:regulation of enolase protein 1 (concanavalin A-like superfamily)